MILETQAAAESQAEAQSLHTANPVGVYRLTDHQFALSLTDCRGYTKVCEYQGGVRVAVSGVEAGQRDWQRKFESGEFTAEANAAKRRLESAAHDLLAACKAFVDQREYEKRGQGDTFWIPCNADACRMIDAAIANAEGK